MGFCIYESSKYNFTISIKNFNNQELHRPTFKMKQKC